METNTTEASKAHGARIALVLRVALRQNARTVAHMEYVIRDSYDPRFNVRRTWY